MDSLTQTPAYDLNSTTPWFFNDTLPPNLPVWILVEEDTCDPTLMPGILRVMYHPLAVRGQMIRVLDICPDRSHHYLDVDCWTIKAWRTMTEHAGTFDRYYQDHGITEESNWSVLDKLQPYESSVFFSMSLDLKTDLNIKIANDLFVQFVADRDDGVDFEIKESPQFGLKIFSNGEALTPFAMIDFVLQVIQFCRIDQNFSVTYSVVAPENQLGADRGGEIVFDCRSLKATIFHIGNRLFDKPKRSWKNWFFKPKAKVVEPCFTKTILKTKTMGSAYIEGWRYARAQLLYCGRSGPLLPNKDTLWCRGFNDCIITTSPLVNNS